MEEERKLTRKEKAALMYSNFRTYLYNKESGEVMGRDAESWGKISLFFLIYYACLAAFFAAMFAIAFSTMPEIKDGPKYTSILEDKPMLLVFPEGGVGSWEASDINGTIKSSYESFLNGYNHTPCHLKEKCTLERGYRPENEKLQCGFDRTSLDECNDFSKSGFGYGKNRPCLYLRLTKIYGWKPKPENNLKAIKLQCETDDSNAAIKYYPDADEAFPISFWPFRGHPSFRPPIAAIQVVNHTRQVTVKCKAIAKNIELSDTYKLKKGAYGQLEFNVAAPPKKM